MAGTRDVCAVAPRKSWPLVSAPTPPPPPLKFQLTRVSAQEPASQPLPPPISQVRGQREGRALASKAPQPEGQRQNLDQNPTVSGLGGP